MGLSSHAKDNGSRPARGDPSGLVGGNYSNKNGFTEKQALSFYYFTQGLQMELFILWQLLSTVGAHFDLPVFGKPIAIPGFFRVATLFNVCVLMLAMSDLARGPAMLVIQLVSWW